MKFVATTIVLIAAASPLLADVPNLINHQGRISVNGTNFTGTGNFKFLLFRDADSDQNNGNEIPVWSNTTTVPGSMADPAAQVMVPVANGHYAVALGDTNLANMANLPGSLDPGTSNLYLRTWFSPGAGAFERLTPDARITSTPFALLARHTTGGLAADFEANNFDLSEIGSLGIGTSNPAERLHISSVGSARMLLEADTNDGPFENENPQLIFRQDGGNVGMTLGFSESRLGDDVFGFVRRTGGADVASALSIEANTGDIGIGTNAPSVRLDIADTTHPLLSAPVIRATANSAKTASSMSVLDLVHSTTGNMANGFGSSLLFSIQDNGGVRRNIGRIGAVRAGNDTTGMLQFQPYQNGTLRTLMTLDADGDLALLDTGGLTEFTLRANDYSSGPWLAMYGEGIADPASATDADRTFEIHGDEGSGGSNLLMRNGPGKTTVELDAAKGTGDASFALWDNTGANASFYVNSHDGDTGGAYLDMRRRDNVRAIEIDSDEDDGDAVIRLWGSTGDGTTGTASIILDSDIGGGSRITVDVLELRGADLSENFDVRPTHENGAIEPGMVVSIDPESPGELMIAETAYDTRVAGVLSGANGVRTGILMSQPDTIADGEHAVAMTGRVWVFASCENGPIAPGDLLTTSSLPGHAMRASDPARVFGSVIGKAMTTLDEGEGKVLVLVSLQ